MKMEGIMKVCCATQHADDTKQTANEREFENGQCVAMMMNSLIRDYGHGGEQTTFEVINCK
jgi:hypothetical protein